MSAPWLDELPDGWQEIALRYLARIETGSRDTVDAVPGGEYPFIIRSQTPLEIDTYSYDTEAVLTAGDGAVGEIFHHIDGRFEVHQRVYVVHDFHGLHGRFFYYYFSSEFGQTVAYGGAQSTVASLRRPMLTGFPVAVPPLDVQRAIADYLDRETAQIDAFIAKNEELITLLTERRAAVIADAATGGVRQEARLVDSGVDWIGSIPTNWDVRPLRWSARIRTGTTPSGDMVFADDPGEPWIRPDDLDVSGTASVASRWLTPEGATQGRPAVPGATLVCTIGATLGKSGRIERASYFNQQITSVSWALNDEFLYWVFVAAREAVARLSVGNTLPILNNDKLATLRIPVPPVEEQGVIVDYIRAQTTRIDAAIQTAHRGVALARERRAALISAAVTGKIDVGVDA